MVNMKAKALGILFPNFYDKLVPDLTNERLMASIPFGSRYRMVDFILSSMVNCGIDNVTALVQENYFSLLDHIGTGREWDLSRKNGGMNIFPPYAQKRVGMTSGRVGLISTIFNFLKSQKEEYVVLCDTNMAVNFDFKAMLSQHMETGADITIAYKREPIPESLKDQTDNLKGMFFTLDLDEQKITKMHINPKADGEQNLCMNIFMMKREKMIEIFEEAFVTGAIHFERDVLAPNINKIQAYAYEHTGYLARITDLKSYFDENLKLLDDANLDALFSKNPIYTKIRDDNPTRYINGSAAKNVLVADGCVIEGEIENCILFRGVKIGKGAKVKNAVLMQDTVVGENVQAEYIITDKKVSITEGQKLHGTDTFPVFISKRKIV